MTTAVLVLLGAGTVIFLAGLQDKTIVQTYKDLLAGKPIDIGTGTSNTGPTFGGGTGSDKNFSGGAGGTLST